MMTFTLAVDAWLSATPVTPEEPRIFEWLASVAVPLVFGIGTIAFSGASFFNALGMKRLAEQIEEREATRNSFEFTRITREHRESLIRDITGWAAGEFADIEQNVRPRADSVADLVALQVRLLESGFEGADELQQILGRVDSVGPEARRGQAARTAVVGLALDKMRRALAAWIIEPHELPEVLAQCDDAWLTRVSSRSDDAMEGENDGILTVVRMR